MKILSENYELSARTSEKPFQQALHLGFYHERLIAFTKDEYYMNDAIREGIRIREDLADLTAIQKHLRTLKGKFEFVGRVDDFRSNARGRQAFLSNPLNFRVLLNQTGIAEEDLTTRSFKVRRYSRWKNNCQHHAYAVLRKMGLR